MRTGFVYFPLHREFLRLWRFETGMFHCFVKDSEAGTYGLLVIESALTGHVTGVERLRRMLCLCCSVAGF